MNPPRSRKDRGGGRRPASEYARPESERQRGKTAPNLHSASPPSSPITVDARRRPQGRRQRHRGAPLRAPHVPDGLTENPGSTPSLLREGHDCSRSLTLGAETRSRLTPGPQAHHASPFQKPKGSLANGAERRRIQRPGPRRWGPGHSRLPLTPRRIALGRLTGGKGEVVPRLTDAAAERRALPARNNQRERTGKRRCHRRSARSTHTPPLRTGPPLTPAHLDADGAQQGTGLRSLRGLEWEEIGDMNIGTDILPVALE